MLLEKKSQRRITELTLKIDGNPERAASAMRF
jgi:hypothetical protein